MATITSLGAYAKARNVNKGTVHRCAEKLGIDTSQGLSKDAISQLESKYEMLRPQVTATAEATAETGVTLVTYEPSEQGLAAPRMRPITISSDEILTQTWEDPLAVAEIVVDMLKAKGDAQDQALGDLRQRRQDTRDAVLMIKSAHRREHIRQQDTKIHSLVEKARLEDAAAELSDLTKGAIKQEAS